MGAAFALLVACFLTCLVCGLVLFFLRWRDINDAFKHPLLQVRPFKRYPLSIQAAIYLDYFLHLTFPKGQRGIIGNANRNLRHVDAKRLPLAVRWPVAGFWGSCLFGLLAMVVVWVTLLVNSL